MNVNVNCDVKFGMILNGEELKKWKEAQGIEYSDLNKAFKIYPVTVIPAGAEVKVKFLYKNRVANHYSSDMCVIIPLEEPHVFTRTYVDMDDVIEHIKRAVDFAGLEKGFPDDEYIKWHVGMICYAYVQHPTPQYH